MRLSNKKLVTGLIFLSWLGGMALFSSPLFAASDPSGANTGTIADVTAATAGQPTLDEVAATAGHNKISINFGSQIFSD